MRARQTGCGSAIKGILALLSALIFVVTAVETGLAAEIQNPGLLKPERILIFNAGTSLSAEELADIEARLECRFSAEVEVLESPLLRMNQANPTARRAYSRTRQQYRAGQVLDDLVGRLKNADSTVTFQFVLVDADLFDGPYNFLFGMSDLSESIGVYSTYRLLPSPGAIKRSDPIQSRGLLAERLVKLLSKNTAKMAGLTRSKQCIMRWPNSVGDLDRIPNYFCESDAAALKAAEILSACEAPIALDADRGAPIQMTFGAAINR